jgi:hypothetical protein
MHAAGWRIRYDPTVNVDQMGPGDLRALLARRYRYGTSAGPLAARRPGRLAALIINPPSAVSAGFALAGRPKLAMVTAVAHGARMARRARHAGVPAAVALAWTTQAIGHALIAAERTATMLAPGALAAGFFHRRARQPAPGLLLAPTSVGCAPLARFAGALSASSTTSRTGSASGLEQSVVEFLACSCHPFAQFGTGRSNESQAGRSTGGWWRVRAGRWFTTSSLACRRGLGEWVR